MDLTIIEHQNQRVLTTAQLAEVYGADEKRISENFSRNKDRYKPGKHFILLDGEDLKAFKTGNQHFAETLKFTSILYLWTEKGAWLHAKSLNTDQAWEAYETLVDDYYNVIQNRPQSQLEILQASINQLVEQERRMTEFEQRLIETEKKQDGITEILSLNPTDWRKKVNSIINKIAQAHGGFDSYQHFRNESYTKLEERAACKLSIRLTNKKQKMALEGVTKSKVEKVTKMDVIADDSRLTEIYLAIVKEMAILYQVDVSDLNKQKEEVTA